MKDRKVFVIYEKILIFAVVKEIGDREGRLFLL